jgi:hypothetical protein
MDTVSYIMFLLIIVAVKMVLHLDLKLANLSRNKHHHWFMSQTGCKVTNITTGSCHKLVVMIIVKLL